MMRIISPVGRTGYSTSSVKYDTNRYAMAVAAGDAKHHAGSGSSNYSQSDGNMAGINNR